MGQCCVLLRCVHLHTENHRPSCFHMYTSSSLSITIGLVALHTKEFLILLSVDMLCSYPDYSQNIHND